jgi:hypothetical protein
MTCKKCGSTMIKKQYVDRKHESLEGPDHLACECCECGYEWVMECVDFAKPISSDKLFVTFRNLIGCRARNALDRAGITTMERLLEEAPDCFRNMRNVGVVTRIKMRRIALSLGVDLPI